MPRLENTARPFRLVRESNSHEIPIIPIRTVRNMTREPRRLLESAQRGIGRTRVGRYRDRSPERNPLLHLHTCSQRGNVFQHGLYRPEIILTLHPIHSHEIRAQEPALKPPFHHALISADPRPGFSRPPATPSLALSGHGSLPVNPLLTSGPSSRALSPDSPAGIRGPPRCRAPAPPPRSPPPRAP